MGDIQDLKNHYDKKWQELLDVTESEYKGILEYSVWMRYKDKNREYVKLLIEYDQSNPCYGIYFGCKMNVEKKGDDKLEELKEQIWGAYKDRIYPNSSVQMDNVFLEAVLISFDKFVKHDLDECDLYHGFRSFSEEFIIDG